MDTPALEDQVSAYVRRENEAQRARGQTGPSGGAAAGEKTVTRLSALVSLLNIDVKAVGLNTQSGAFEPDNEWDIMAAEASDS
jgi:hypothetical protein